MQNKTLTRLKASFGYRTGLAELPSPTKRFILTHFNFLLFTTIPGVFINTFFFRQDGKMSTVAIYNAISYLGIAVVMQLTSKISLKKSPVFNMRVGLALFNIFYITLLLLQNNAAKFMPLLAFENAVAGGFYWQGYNELVRAYTSEGIFDKTVSLIGFSNSIVTMVVPILSGYIITFCPGVIGYSVIFTLAFICSVFTTYLTMKLEKTNITGQSNLSGVYHYIFTNKKVLIACTAELFHGIRNAAFPLFLSIIYFKFVSNESLLGINNMLCGIASIVSFLIASRLIRPGNRMKCTLTSVLISIVVFLPLLFVMNAPSIFILAIVNAFIGAFIDNPLLAAFYGLFEKPVPGIPFSQIMAAREVFWATGRAIGLFSLIFFSQNTQMLAILVLILNVSSLLAWALFRKIDPYKTGVQNGK